jgi:hypothetical protein
MVLRCRGILAANTMSAAHDGGTAERIIESLLFYARPGPTVKNGTARVLNYLAQLYFSGQMSLPPCAIMASSPLARGAAIAR